MSRQRAPASPQQLRFQLAQAEWLEELCSEAPDWQRLAALHVELTILAKILFPWGEEEDW